MWTSIWEIAYTLPLPLLLSAVLAYLLGSLNCAIILTRATQKTDIRNMGSGNAGATNVLRTQGWGPALVTGVGDLFKSLVAVLIGQLILVYFGVNFAYDAQLLRLVGGYVAGLFCIIGHLYPLYFGFRGGKGVVATLGLSLILDWRVAVFALTVFGIMVALTKTVSASSLTAGLSMIAVAYLFPFWFDKADPTVCAFCSAMMGACILFVFIKHIPNIRRLINGTENRFDAKKDEPDDNQDADAKQEQQGE